MNSTEMLFKSEMKQIEDEFEKGRLRLKERIAEGIEERRRRAREEKEGEGVVPAGMLAVLCDALSQRILVGCLLAYSCRH